jgi:peptidoglycan/xylan/chitin deacetylase (PgdA/CDA1 family)
MLAAIVLSSALALTFDDLPGSAFPQRDRCNAAAIASWNSKLLATLRKHRAPAIGFVNSARCIDVGPVLEQWLKEGHQLGNHTAHHVDANAVTADEFERDVIAGESPLKEVLARHGHELVWFRYPMLHTGPAPDVRDRIAAFLASRGYRNGVVTIDSEEFLYNNAYASSYPEHAQAIAKDYIRFMESVLTFFEKRTLEVVGRPIAHVLLLHVSSLNADHLDELLTMYEKRGYRFITIDEAMKDPAYQLKDGYAGKVGLSWIHRWGVAKGMKIAPEPRAKIP